jgi:L-lysine exporter family protein LysE/ArgO
MSSLFVTGLVLGASVAIPMGPINIAMMRQTLVAKDLYGGLSIGFGATAADLTYLLLVSIGILNFLTTPALLHTIGIVGAIYILYLGIKITVARISLTTTLHVKPNKSIKAIEGYLVALLSPYNIVFWTAVVTSQVTQHSAADLRLGIWQIGLGLITGILAWVSCFNLSLYHLSDKFSEQLLIRLNRVSGLVLVAFALWKLFELM